MLGKGETWKDGYCRKKGLGAPSCWGCSLDICAFSIFGFLLFLNKMANCHLNGNRGNHKIAKLKKGNYCKIPFLFSEIIIIKTSGVYYPFFDKMRQSGWPIKIKVRILNSIGVRNKHII